MKVCTKDSFIEKIKNTVTENRLIEKGDTVICALSGGADSVCLLYCLKALSETIGFSLCAAHLNHMIRGDEALRDEEFSKRLCEKEGIEFHLRRCDIPALSAGENTEEVGRRERYRFFNDLAGERKRSKIAVAHNLNDLAETMVMRLARGSSVFGLSGIKIKNDNIIRPLLYTKRSEIEEFLSLYGIEYITDSTNLSDNYTRNKIRHLILPQMTKINNDFLDSAKRTAQKCKTAADFIAQSVKKDYGGVKDRIELNRFSLMHRAEKEYVAAESAYKAGVKEISDKQISDVISLENLSSGKEVQLPGGFKAVRIYDEIAFSKRGDKINYNYELKMGNNYIEEADYTVTVTESEKGIDLDKVTLPLYARPKTEGDRISPVGMDGEKKVKRIYTDSKLPCDKRERYPVITDKEKVIFALGRCDKSAASDSKTKRAVTIKITEGKTDNE